MDKILNFIRENKYAIVIFSYKQQNEYKRMRNIYHVGAKFHDGIALRFEHNHYSGYADSPDTCYNFVGGKVYFLGDCYNLLDFRKRASARVV